MSVVTSKASSSSPRVGRPSKRSLSSTEVEHKEEPALKRPKSSASSSPITAVPTSKVVSSGSRQILFVTGNKGKLREVQHYLGDALGGHLINEKINLTEIQGTAEEILSAKLKEAQNVVTCEKAQGILVEDTNLCFTAYGGLPGPYIKDFLDRAGRQGLIDMMKGKANNAATAVCLFGFIDCATAKVKIFKGVCPGKIASEIVGESGFGWDPVFLPDADSDGRTFAQMTTAQKNEISHRAKALAKLKPFIEAWIVDTGAAETDESKEVSAKVTSDSSTPPTKA